MKKPINSPDKHKYKDNVCVRCGCERVPSKSKYEGTYYKRSKMFFDKSPECIDWKIENNKTID